MAARLGCFFYFGLALLLFLLVPLLLGERDLMIF